MSRTVSELKDGVSGLLTGTNLNNVTGLDNALERALRTFLQKASIPEASTVENVTLYDGVYDYVAPSAVFGSTLRDFRPLGIDRTSEDFAYREYISDFDRTKQYVCNGYKLTFETRAGVNVMRVAQNRATPKIILDTMADTTGWTSGGSLSLLSKDQTFYYSSPAALRFTLTGNSSGYIERTLSQQFDLTNYQNVAMMFLALELPALNLTNVKICIGSSNADYYEIIATAGQLGAWTTGQFLDTPFDLSTATTTGTPVITAIDYIRVTFTHSATITNARVGYLWISLPCPHQMVYETNYVFSSSGVLSNRITNDSDLILLNDSAYNIYEHECAITIGLQMGGAMASGLVGNINMLLNGARAKNGAVLSLGLYDKYRADNPSEEIRKLGSWYD
jgi:hypothetical protein